MTTKSKQAPKKSKSKTKFRPSYILWYNELTQDYEEVFVLCPYLIDNFMESALVYMFPLASTSEKSYPGDIAIVSHAGFYESEPYYLTSDANIPVWTSSKPRKGFKNDLQYLSLALQWLEENGLTITRKI